MLLNFHPDIAGNISGFISKHDAGAVFYHADPQCQLVCCAAGQDSVTTVESLGKYCLYAGTSSFKWIRDSEGDRAVRLSVLLAVLAGGAGSVAGIGGIAGTEPGLCL